MLKWLAAALALTGVAFAQPTLTLAPSVITSCASPGLGRTRLFWNATGTDPVQLRVGGPDGVLMGVNPPQGNLETGDWVSDGTIFVLTTSSGAELARVTARVACTASSANSYLPLDVGDEWVYRIDNRTGTGVYQTRRVERAEIVQGQLYFVLSFHTGAPQAGYGEVPYRADSQGRVYYLLAPGSEQLLFDPAGSPSGALYQVLTAGRPAQTSVGRFADTLTYQWFNSLTLEQGVYARGVGLVSSTTNMLTGSSGGFVQSYTLVYAKIAGTMVFAAPTPGIELAAESRVLDVTGGNVTNCAVPCYFAACSLLPGADPPGTYKPCFRARARVQESPADFATADPQQWNVLFELLNDSNVIVSGGSDLVQLSVEQPEAMVSRSILLPGVPGHYRLRARTLNANNTELDSAIVSVQVR